MGIRWSNQRIPGDGGRLLDSGKTTRHGDIAVGVYYRNTGSVDDFERQTIAEA